MDEKIVNSIDGYDVVFDTRGRRNSEALTLLLDSNAALKAVANTENEHIR